MATDTVWGQRAPGDKAMRAVDPDTGIPGTLTDPDRALVVIGEFFASDAMRIPENTPAFDGDGLHPYAGQRVRVTFAFRSLDPAGVHPGEHYAHLWNHESGVGVCETPGGFIVYEAATLPSSFRRSLYTRKKSESGRWMMLNRMLLAIWFVTLLYCTRAFRNIAVVKV